MSVARMLAVGAGVATATFGLLLPTSASAAVQSISTGRVQLCSKGSYSSQLVFSPPNAQAYATDTVPVGSCKTFEVPGEKGSPTHIQPVHSGTSSPIEGTAQSAPDSAGMKIATKGSASHATWVYLQN